MREELQFLWYSAVIPTITAALVAAPLLRFLPQSVAGRCSLAIAAAVAFFVGYALLPDWAPLVPARHWHWLPHLAVTGAVIGCLSVLVPLPAWGKYLLYLLLGLIGASQLVPTWDNLQPGRTVLIPLLAAYIALISLLLVLLPARLRGRLFVFLLAATAANTAAIVGAEAALKIGQTAFVLAPALFGCWLAILLAHRNGPKESPLNEEMLGLATAALIPLYTLLTGGSAFVGAMETTEPAYILLLIPAAPVLLWPFAFRPLDRLAGVPAAIANTLTVAIVPLAVIAWILMSSEPDEWGQLPEVTTIEASAGSESVGARNSQS